METQLSLRINTEEIIIEVGTTIEVDGEEDNNRSRGGHNNQNISSRGSFDKFHGVGRGGYNDQDNAH